MNFLKKKIVKITKNKVLIKIAKSQFPKNGLVPLQKKQAEIVIFELKNGFKKLCFL